MVEIQIGLANKETLSAIKTPFKNVTKVTFFHGSLCPLLMDIAKWFPNAETLELSNMVTPSLKFHEKIKIKMAPMLKHLDVKKTNQRSDAKPDKISEAVIEANPRLKSLSNEYDIVHADDEYVGMFYQYAIIHKRLDRRLPHLESLRLIVYDEKDINFEDHEWDEDDEYLDDDSRIELRFAQLNDLYIDFYESTALNGLPIFAKKLEKLTLIGSKLGHKCLQFIRNNKTPSYIKLVGKWSSDNIAGKMIQLLSSLPNLNELHFPIQYCSTKPNHVINLLTDCKHLRKLVVLFRYGSDRQNFETIFNNSTVNKNSQWKATRALGKHESKGSYSHNKHMPYHLIFDKVIPKA